MIESVNLRIIIEKRCYEKVTSTLAKNKFVLILVYIIHAVVYNYRIKNFLEGSHFFSQLLIKKSISYNN